MLKKKNKKALVPVIATLMIIGVALSAIILFQQRFDYLQSDYQTRTDDEGNIDLTLEIQDQISSNLLYITSSQNISNNNIKIESGSGTLKCSFSNQNLTIGLNQINITSCSLTSKSPYNVVLITEKRIYEKTVLNK